MKKLFTTLLLVLGFSAISYAQQDAGTVQFGVTAGLNGSYLSQTNGYQSTAIKAGFNAGVSAEYYFSEKWSLKIKALYDQKGWGNGYVSVTDANGNTAETDNININLNYITIPVLANWHLGASRQWYVDFGPFVGILMSANGGGYDLKSTFPSIDGGVDAGVGIQLPISDRAKFFIEVDGQAGIVNQGGDDFYTGSLTTERSSLNIGINF